MAIIKKHSCGALLLSVLWLSVSINPFAASDVQWPVFGRDTVLVWKVQNQEFIGDFVVRIAEFFPDRFLEWEDAKTQGTVFIPSRGILEAKSFSTGLFESGIDVRAKDATTLWLSQKIFRDLKERKKIKCDIDNVQGWMTLQGSDQLAIEVNHHPMILPVIKVLDDREAERWFLDVEDNPLMVQHLVRQFRQTLVSITTDQPNTLRWIKGKKLANLPR